MSSNGPSDILSRIAARRRERIADRPIEAAGIPAGRSAATESGLRRRCAPQSAATEGDRFMEALTGRRGRAVIAEIKMGSPRLGDLAERLDPRRQAELYARHGAAALSVVVEPDHFGGSYELLAACREASGLPALAKDFVVDPVQIEWAREAGAGAVLLIAALLDSEELLAYAARARELGLAPLVELHDEAELDRLGGGAWELVGVNSRDLRSFEVDLGHAEALAPRLPAGALKVAESGIASGADVARLRAAGYDAFLVGEALLLADDPAALLEELAQ